MNFTKVLSQLNHTNIKNCQIDHKFMSSSTFFKKYRTKDLSQIANTINHRNSTDTTLLKQAKHRYFQDIEIDEIQDANIFGYSTFEYFTYFKKNQAKMTQLSKRNREKQLKKQKSQSKLNKSSEKTETLNFQNKEKSDSFMRPKTAIVSRGTPTKRRVKHKLSLNQIQKVATSQHLLPASIKQQFFTEEIFQFKPVEQSRSGQRTAKFYQDQKPRSSYKEVKQKKSIYYVDKQIDKLPNKNQLFQQKSTHLYRPKTSNVNLIKRKRNNLDPEKIGKERALFSKSISQHFQNLTKKEESKQEISNVIKSGGLKSIVYKKVSNHKKENQESVHYSKNHSKTLIQDEKNQPASQSIKHPEISVTKNNPNQIPYLITEPQIKQENFLKQVKTSSDISFFHPINSLLLQPSQLSDLQFTYDNNYTPLHFSALEQTIARSINNQASGFCNTKSNSFQQFSPKSYLLKHSKNKSQFYNFIIVHCSTLEWIRLDNVELKDEKFFYKENQVSVLLIAQQLMKTSSFSDFVHVIVTRKHPKSYNQHEEILVFQTFIHNSDIKYFESREIQIHYFKYFLKQFITFDPSIKKKEQIDASVSLLLQNEVKTPPQFEDFCKTLKIKQNLNILALKNLEAKHGESSFRSIEINLSKLLTDSIETVMMVKKELFEGYNWRGVSLAKGAKQYKGYHLEHFYI